MELLSRRSSGDRMSTLKRSRSYRASVKLMSKIRNHASLRLTVGFDLSPNSKNPMKKDSRIPQELPQEEASRLRKNPENDSRSSSSSSSRKTSTNDDRESREIAKDLKSKLTLADRIMGKGRKDADKSSAKEESVKSPKVNRIFRRKHSSESPQENIWGKDQQDQRVSCEVNACQESKQASYENPMFLPDSSLDSSVSSFLFEVGEEAMEEEDKKEREEEVEERQRKGQRHDCDIGHDVLTVVVDSHKAAINQPRYRKASYEPDKSKDEGHVGQEESAFRRRCETDPSRCPCKARNEGGEERSANPISGYRRIAESFSGFDRSRISRFHCKATPHQTGKSAGKADCPQDSRSFDNVKKGNATCPSRSCRIRTVDNIANFWTSGRAGSFRSKMATGKNRQDAEEAKDYEQVGRERVLVSTSSGSSTPDQ